VLLADGFAELVLLADGFAELDENMCVVENYKNIRDFK
jgi:hypothetical protein